MDPLTDVQGLQQFPFTHFAEITGSDSLRRTKPGLYVTKFGIGILLKEAIHIGPDRRKYTVLHFF